MEGDAGASRLNPTDADDSLRTEVQAEDSPESEAGTEQIKTEAATEQLEVKAEAASDPAADEATTEVKADDSPEPEPVAARGPSRLGRGWLAAISAALLLAAGGLGFGGYRALISHQESQSIARNNEAALAAAKACVAATQAPDTNAMAQSEQKIIDCGTDEYRSQALLYTSMLVQAYQAANVHVQVTDERAAVERTNNDGTVDILVALRVKVSNSAEQNQETGYRLRVTMSPVDGQYKIAKLVTVTK
ncbi:Mce protein [Mycobacterium sp.]|uniref:Mce protein n=1 Tax=Mycobacterium sp. TaxID=1785 RepID=UPI002BFA7C27|nr:Mce protein [Mycobacterium sp.]HTQ21150.1 Mce protein [Mycobacterium sp.]